MGNATTDVTSTTPPCPKSPPKYPDLCGRRRLQLEVQILNREIGFLQDELQSLEGIQPVSRCCKELNEFVGTKPDPIIPVNKKRHGSCRMWRWIRSKICCYVSWICCMEKPPTCCSPESKNCDCCSCECTCGSCRFPNCTCGSCRLPSCTCCNSCAEVCHVSSCCHCSNCCSSNCFNSCCKCKLRCCTDCGSCCSEPCCCCMKCSCIQPQCFSGGFSCFQRWSCCCKLNCGKSSCCRSFGALRTPSCPGCSCGCVWTCPTCGDICRCIKRNNPCCISGCFC